MNTVPFSFGPPAAYREGSGLRSKRDAENPAMAWKKNKAVSLNVDEVMRTLAAMQNELAQLRKRRLGGTGAGADKWPPVLYDKALSWSIGDWIWVKPDNDAVTAGAIDSGTGLMSYATPGLWRCTQPTSPSSTIIGETPTPSYNLPQLPYPTPDDVTASNVYWAFISGVSAC